MYERALRLRCVAQALAGWLAVSHESPSLRHNKRDYTEGQQQLGISLMLVTSSRSVKIH